MESITKQFEEAIWEHINCDTRTTSRDTAEAALSCEEIHKTEVDKILNEFIEWLNLGSRGLYYIPNSRIGQFNLYKQELINNEVKKEGK